MRQAVIQKKTAVVMAVFFSILAAGMSPAAAQGLASLDEAITRVIANASAAVVTVESRVQQTRAPLYAGQKAELGEPVTALVGSGLLIDSAGHVLTVLSLVEGYDSYRIEVDGHSVGAHLVGLDRSHGLAILKADSVFNVSLEASTIPPLPGRLALAFGRAVGSTGYPVLGIIAGRQSDGSYLIAGSVVPALAGGGVFDLSGRLLGIIVSGGVGGPEPYGGMVMLPVSMVYAAADRIICCGDREAGYLGMHTIAIELVSSAGKVLGEAVAVSTVEPNSPAEAAGLHVGDVITRIGHRPVISDRDLQRLVSTAGPDSLVPIEFIRDHGNRTMTLKTTSYPRFAEAAVRTASAGPVGRDQMIAADLQRRIDAMRAEMLALQKELDRLLTRIRSTR